MSDRQICARLVIGVIMQPPTHMRSGFGSDDLEDPRVQQMLTQVQALMLAFSREAIVVAGRCTCAQGRNSVSAKDMRDALMYCARTFFQKDDADLRTRVDEAVQFMNEADGEEEEDGEEGYDSEEEEEEEEEDKENATGSTDQTDLTEISSSDVQLRRNVQTVVNTWHLWSPTDPVHVLVKNAIDNTPC